jgi:hypothetical protein
MYEGLERPCEHNDEQHRKTYLFHDLLPLIVPSVSPSLIPEAPT